MQTAEQLQWSMSLSGDDFRVDPRMRPWLWRIWKRHSARRNTQIRCCRGKGRAIQRGEAGLKWVLQACNELGIRIELVVWLPRMCT